MKTTIFPIYPILALAILFLSLSACEDNAGIEFDDVPVVEGYLYEENPVEIQLTRKSPFDTELNLDPADLDALSLSIKSEGKSYALLPQGDGLYRSGKDGLNIQSGKTYQLEFEFKGKTVGAETTVLAKPLGFTQDATSISIPQISFPPSGGMRNFPDPVKFNWSNADQSYYLLVVENTETDPDPIFDFSSLGIDPPSRLFRVEPTQNNTFEVRSQQFQYYGQHRVILYHINPEYALLYQDSGDNSLNLKSPPTNVKNGLGIFTAISSDTLYLNVTQ